MAYPQPSSNTSGDGRGGYIEGDGDGRGGYPVGDQPRQPPKYTPEAVEKRKKTVGDYVGGFDLAADAPFRTSAETRDLMARAQTAADQGAALQKNPQVGNIDAAPTVDAYTIERPLDIGTSRTFVQRGIDAANNGINLAMDSRVREAAQLGYLNQVQMGNGPSVGAEMFNRGAGKAADLMRLSGSQAAQQFGQASMAQQMATREAGLAAADQIRQSSGAAMRAQAAMAAASRGGGMGGAMLNAQNNQAITAQQATVQGSQAINSANRQAADIAAGAQLQAGGALERSNLNAGMVGADMMSEGARMRSAEQLAAMGMFTDANGRMRQGDLATSAAGVAAGGLGNTVDARFDDTARFNAGMGIDVAKFNAGQNTTAATGNADRAFMLLQGNQANEQFNRSLGSQQQLAYTNLYGATSQAEDAARRNKAFADADSRSHARDRWANYDVGQTTNSISARSSDRAMAGNIISGALTAGGAIAGTVVGGPAGTVAGGTAGAAAGSAIGSAVSR